MPVGLKASPLTAFQIWLSQIGVAAPVPPVAPEEPPEPALTRRGPKLLVWFQAVGPTLLPLLPMWPPMAPRAMAVWGSCSVS